MERARDSFDLLCKEGDVSGPVGDDSIAQAEAILGVKFPAEYCELLRHYGAVSAPGVEVYGLLDRAVDGSPPMWQDVVSVTKKLREWNQIGAEKKEFLPFSDDGTGVYFFFDTSKAPETSIFAAGPGVEKKFDIDLFSFLVNLSEGQLLL